MLRARTELIATGVLTVVAIAYLVEARTFPDRGALFPTAVGVVVLVILVANAIRILTRAPEPEAHKSEPAEGAEAGAAEAAAPTGTEFSRVMAAWFVAFAVLIWLLGFKFGVALAAFLWLRFASRESWWVSLLMTAGLYVAVTAIFGALLNVPIANGTALRGWPGQSADTDMVRGWFSYLFGT